MPLFVMSVSFLLFLLFLLFVLLSSLPSLAIKREKSHLFQRLSYLGAVSGEHAELWLFG